MTGVQPAQRATCRDWCTRTKAPEEDNLTEMGEITENYYYKEDIPYNPDNSL